MGALENPSFDYTQIFEGLGQDLTILLDGLILLEEFIKSNEFDYKFSSNKGITHGELFNQFRYLLKDTGFDVELEGYSFSITNHKVPDELWVLVVTNLTSHGNLQISIQQIH